jgi:hypothetical protein
MGGMERQKLEKEMKNESFMNEDQNRGMGRMGCAKFEGYFYLRKKWRTKRGINNGESKNRSGGKIGGEGKGRKEELGGKRLSLDRVDGNRKWANEWG